MQNVYSGTLFTKLLEKVEPPESPVTFHLYAPALVITEVEDPTFAVIVSERESPTLGELASDILTVSP